jgi:uncharacterized protein (TIGR02145 family)
MKINSRRKSIAMVATGVLISVLIACDKDDENITVTDIDGNVYHTVKIGSQVWMVENLKVTSYNDGTPIPLVTDQAEWTSMTGPGYCWYDNEEATYKNTYGALYNWHTVNTGKLCPEGWHVPTDEEWTTLCEYLDGDTIAGGKLKAKGTIEDGDGLWDSPNEGATDEYGFSALPGGGRYFNGVFGWMGHYGTCWTSTESSANNAYVRYMRYNYKVLVRDQYDKKTGYSVRCIKN